MDRTLVNYVRALRAAGADASIAESIDAARAVALLGYADRRQLKDGLGVVLAKTPAEKLIHARVFDQFFGAVEASAEMRQTGDGASANPPDARPQPAGEAPGQPGQPGQDAGGGPHADRPAAPTAPTAASAATAASGGDALQQLIVMAAEARGGASSAEGRERMPSLGPALHRAAEAAQVDDIQFHTQVGPLTRRLLEALGIAPLDARIRQLLLEPQASGSPDPQAELSTLQAARETLRRAARALVEQRFELYGRPATEAFMQDVVAQRSLGRLAPHDMERMRVVVARMARRMAVKHSRRRRVQLRGQLDFRRMIRASAGHDSVPHRLHFKYRRKDKPRFVALCDVSGSVAAHVRFLLLFLYALHGSVADLRSFAFANQLGDVGPLLENLPFDEAFERILHTHSGSTDYGQAFTDLQDQFWDVIDRRTTVIILGDGRSNHAEPRVDILAEIASRAKRVLWLCPEPKSRWGSGDSVMPKYAPFCTLATHVASAADLERAIDEALAAYG
ncbi:VWA domain-containing protein [Aquabacterium sp. OR-4]|uniref:VWA domain-containing protein n=1 Tax=Aquabacterium sp. OR-4 TaxID=2978127 RepID=UPI0028C5BCAB|nr:VWA domain-containing protein [Aquabacterium sp. OR-4]MDT7838149.1 VWA domain-containing protein [Aquabacterium sp. OR-4]